MSNPVNVAPIIRLGRYTLLGTGVTYGFLNHQRLSNKEAKVREIEAKRKVIRDAQLAKEKQINAEIEAKALAALSRAKKH